MTRQRAGMRLSIPLPAAVICGGRSSEKLTAKWETGERTANEAKAVTVTLDASNPGPIFNNATAKSTCVQTNTVFLKTNMRGAPASPLDVADVSDPTEYWDSVVKSNFFRGVYRK